MRPTRWKNSPHNLCFFFGFHWQVVLLLFHAHFGIKGVGNSHAVGFSVAVCFASQQVKWTLLMVVELLGCVSSFQRNRQPCSSGGFCAQNHVLSFLFDIWCYLSQHWVHSFQAPLSQRVLAECSWPQELFLKGREVSGQHDWKNCGLIYSFVWWAIAKLIEAGIYLQTGILYWVTESGFCNIGLYWLCQYEPPKRGKILSAWISFSQGSEDSHTWPVSSWEHSPCPRQSLQKIHFWFYFSFLWRRSWVVVKDKAFSEAREAPN